MVRVSGLRIITAIQLYFRTTFASKAKGEMIRLLLEESNIFYATSIARLRHKKLGEISVL